MLLVWLAVVIFAAANSIVRVLSNLGAAHPIDGRNAVTFCNILFAGNITACAILGATFRRDWTRANVARLTRGDWVAMCALALLSSALAPALIFQALEATTVTNVVLVGRIEPPLLLALAAALTGERVGRFTVAGALVTFAGVALIVALKAHEMGVMIGPGEAYAALGAVTLAVSTLISKRRLVRIPLGIFTVFRTGVGAVVFFVIAASLYGPMHFADVAEPYLWKWMLVYGGVVVVAGQLAWFHGLARCTTTQVSMATSFSPVAGVGFAFLLLGERPDGATVVGGAVIVLGIVVSQLGGKRAEGPERASPEAVEREGPVGFKGV